MKYAKIAQNKFFDFGARTRNRSKTGNPLLMGISRFFVRRIPSKIPSFCNTVDFLGQNRYSVKYFCMQKVCQRRAGKRHQENLLSEVVSF